MSTGKKDVWIGGNAWLRTLRRIDVSTHVSPAQGSLKQSESTVGRQSENQDDIASMGAVAEIVQAIKQAADMSRPGARRACAASETPAAFAALDLSFDWAEKAPSARREADLDTDALFALWRIDEQSQRQLRLCLPAIALALGAYKSHLHEQLVMDRQMRILLPDENLRARVTIGIMDHWSELLGGEIDRPALLRAAAAARTCFDLGVPPRAFLVVGQHIFWLAINSLIADGISDETPAAIDVMSRLVMMSADVVFSICAPSSMAESEAERAARREEMNSLKADAYVDSLTGLFNRRYFDKAMAIEISRSVRQKQPLCLIIADIDLFKRVNDTWGHMAGDSVLARIAQMLRGVGRLPDIVARYGGEEFAIVLPNTRVESARKMAERLRGDIESHPIQISQEQSVALTMSLGVSILGSNKSMSGLVETADAALYRAKAAGGNRVEVGLPNAVYPNTRMACRAFAAAENFSGRAYSGGRPADGF